MFNTSVKGSGPTHRYSCALPLCIFITWSLKVLIWENARLHWLHLLYFFPCALLSLGEAVFNTPVKRRGPTHRYSYALPLCMHTHHMKPNISGSRWFRVTLVTFGWIFTHFSFVFFGRGCLWQPCELVKGSSSQIWAMLSLWVLPTHKWMHWWYSSFAFYSDHLSAQLTEMCLLS